MIKLAKLLADYVSAEVKRRNWSHRDIAKASGLSNTTISKFLRDFDDVRLSTLEGFAKAIEVEPFKLLMTTEERAQWDAKGQPDLASRVAALEAKLSQPNASQGSALSQLEAQLTPEEAATLVTLAQSYISHRPPSSSRKKNTGST